MYYYIIYMNTILLWAMNDFNLDSHTYQKYSFHELQMYLNSKMKYSNNKTLNISKSILINNKKIKSVRFALNS